jgi:hypothetical protein
MNTLPVKEAQDGSTATTQGPRLEFQTWREKQARQYWFRSGLGSAHPTIVQGFVTAGFSAASGYLASIKIIR